MSPFVKVFFYLFAIRLPPAEWLRELPGGLDKVNEICSKKKW